MHTHKLGYGIDTPTRKPFVLGCRGRIDFETIEDLVGFVGARVRALLEGDLSFWASFEADLLSNHGELVGRDEIDIPF
jgi:hypothetical protein